jgi:SAM-dependent methyltransferase
MADTADVSYGGEDLAVLANMPNYYSWIMQSLAPHVRGEVIEYGAGTGTVSEHLLRSAGRLTLVEPSHNLVGILRERFSSDARVEVRSATLESDIRNRASASADTIVLVNVLEHIEHDEDALRELLRVLRPGGKLLIFVPALRALMSKVDVIHGHFRRYHRPELLEKIAKAEGQVEHCRYFDLLGTAPWFVLNRLLGFTTFNSMLVSVNDRMVVPVSRVLESAIEPPFGKNLLVVASRRG